MNITKDPSFASVQIDHAVHSGCAGLSGCYRIQMVDSYGQKSPFCETYCVSSCLAYKLPNAFSPNGDSANDLFRSVRNIAVNRVNFEVFDRWGDLVFQTFDPQLNWNGRTIDGKNLGSTFFTYINAINSNLQRKERFYSTP